MDETRNPNCIFCKIIGGEETVSIIYEDEEIIAEAREEAAAVVAADPELTHLPALRTALDALLDEEREQYLEKG